MTKGDKQMDVALKVGAVVGTLAVVGFFVFCFWRKYQEEKKDAEKKIGGQESGMVDFGKEEFGEEGSSKDVCEGDDTSKERSELDNVD